jgi:hypothetical protein
MIFPEADTKIINRISFAVSGLTFDSEDGFMDHDASIVPAEKRRELSTGQDKQRN